MDAFNHLIHAKNTALNRKTKLKTYENNLFICNNNYLIEIYI